MADADGAGDAVAVRVLAGGLGRQLAGRHQLLDQAVVLGQPVEPALAQAVGARVAGPEEGEVAAEGEQRHERAAARALGPGGDLLVAGQHGGLDRAQEGRRAVGGAKRLQAGGDEPARLVAPLVPAHAVGHGPEPDVGTGDVAVLVQLAHAADVGPGRGAEGVGREAHGSAGSRLGSAGSGWRGLSRSQTKASPAGSRSEADEAASLLGDAGHQNSTRASPSRISGAGSPPTRSSQGSSAKGSSSASRARASSELYQPSGLRCPASTAGGRAGRRA